METNYDEDVERMESVAAELEENGYETSFHVQADGVKEQSVSRESAEEAYEGFLEGLDVYAEVIAEPEDSSNIVHPRGNVTIRISEGGDLEYHASEDETLVDEVRDTLE